MAQQAKRTRDCVSAAKQTVKPDTRTAMRELIAQIRDALPFDAPEGQVCRGECNGCSLKLLDYLDGELCGWEQRLESGETPNFGDLSRLAKTSRKVYAALEKNGLLSIQFPPARRL